MKEGDIEKVRGLLRRRANLQVGLQRLKRSASKHDGVRSIMFDLPDHHWCDVSQERLKSFLQAEVDEIETQLMSLGVQLEAPIEERKGTA